MKTYKRLTLFLFIAFVGVIIYRAFSPYYQGMNVHKDWTTYEKKNGAIESRTTTVEEKIKLQLPQVPQASNGVPEVQPPQQERRPAAVAPAKKYYLGRELSGPFAQEFEKNKSRFSFKNTVVSDWQEQMAERLMRFQDEKTKMYLKHEKSVIEVFQSSAKYMEQVLVTFSMDDGSQYSYRALVESDTGKILETWDRTKNEFPYRLKRQKVGTMSPTGTL